MFILMTADVAISVQTEHRDVSTQWLSRQATSVPANNTLPSQLRYLLVLA